MCHTEVEGERDELGGEEEKWRGCFCFLEGGETVIGREEKGLTRFR